MIEHCLLAASEIAELDIVNSSTVADAVSQIDSLGITRMVITDQSCVSIYDSANQSYGSYIIFPEVIQALDGNKVFSWNYHNGAMQSRAATPIYSYGTLIGCVYMMEYDTEQGTLIQSLQKNTLWITLVLELAVILFSFGFAQAFTRRLRRIMLSMRIIREGEYSHKVIMGGNDELTVLGDEFNDLAEKLQTSEQKRSNFVSDASHELKTPLASIKLLSDSILQNDMDIDTVREFVGDIGNEADRLNRMSQKLLSLSRIETQADSDCEIVYIGPTVEKVVRMLSAMAANNNIRIITDLTDDCPILILEDDLYQIIFNLVENGIKYNMKDGSLTISVHRQDDNAVLQITDTGVGIPEDSLGHIFERFYRVDKARSRKSGGSGLGLAIVRIIVERNRGQIQVASTVGQGTTFTVTFPAFDMEDEV
ncbi:MAG: HAMP domain-containing histidine kinase [Oscillospiraceae bacterium]|nr:HAMP domain-containing histidine kinase [Oscillospiraceae bacterium]